MRRKMLQRMTALCVMAAMLLGAWGTTAVFAADGGTILFSDDFSGLAVGAKISVDSKDATKWNNKAESATSLLVGYKDGDNMVLRISNDQGEKAGGPRLEKKINVTGMKDLTLSYKVKANGCNSALQLWSDGAANKTLVSYDQNKWADIKIAINLEKRSFTTYINGKADSQNQNYTTISDPSTFTLRFAQMVNPGNEVLLDDVVISTTGAVSVAPAATPSATAAPSSSTTSAGEIKDAPKDVAAPAGTTVLFNETHQSLKDATVKTGGTTWSRVVKTDTALVNAVDISGNKVVKFSNAGSAAAYPRLEKSLAFKGLSKFTIQYAVRAVDGRSYVELYSDGAKNVELASIDSNKAWDYVKIDVDLAKKTASSYVNGKELKTGIVLKDITDMNSLTLRFNNSLQPGCVTYIDNVVISTTDAVEINQILAGDGKINFDKVKVTPETPITPNLKQHPRLFINSFDAIKEKINSDYSYQAWYQNVKTSADAYLTIGPPEYSLAKRANILDQSRAVMQRVYTLSFVYNIEKDKKYFDRAIKELEAAAAYPDWTPNEFLATAEMMNAFAIGYDWLYYDLSDAQKAMLMQAMMEKGVSPLIYNYEGELTGGTNWPKTTINWNPVCNGGGVVAALGMVSDQYPDVAEYILERAAASIPNGLKPYAPDGAYPEGTGYWIYGTKYLVYIMDTLNSAMKDGFTLPNKYIFYDKPGIAETAEYPIYYNGPVGAFNFGDAGQERSSTSIMYWFAKKYNKPQYAWYQKNTEQELNKSLSAMEGIFAIIWYDHKNAQLAPGAFGLDKANNAKEKHNGFVLRSSWESPNALYAAMQGGSNRDNHMYLSLGTFILESEGKRWITTPGRGDYNYPNYFSKGAADSPRWTYYVARAEAQNTIIANPTNLADQEVNAQADVIAFESAQNEAFGVLNMTQTNAAFTDAKRGMYLTDNRSKVLLQDEIKTNKPSEIWWFVHTPADITISEDGRSAMLTMATGTEQEQKMWVNIAQGPAQAKLSVMDSVPLPTSPNPNVQTLNFGHKLAINLQSVSDLTLAVEFIPLEKGEAPPTEKTVVKPIKDWKVKQEEPKLSLKLGDVVSLMLGSPNAFAKSEKTYVDPNNLEVRAFEKDGRTLVPVRFIAEKFGATVGWEEETRTATVKYQDKTIQMQIDNTIMTINGQEYPLDVPAQQVNDRTVIPLRAMVESLGKQVFWDDRGLIIISNQKTDFDAATINSLINLLDYRILIDGKDLAFFDTEKTTFDVLVSEQAAAAPVIEFQANGSGAAATIEQPTSATGTAKVTVNRGGAQIVYTINFVKDEFAGLAGTASADVAKSLRVAFGNESSDAPAQPTWIVVKDVAMGAGHTYPKSGTIDNIINSEIENRWSAEGEAWISYDLGEEQNIYAFGLATVSGNSRRSRFDLEISADGETWTKVYSGETSGTTNLFDIITLKDVKTRYIRIFGHGNSANQWNSYTEVRFYRDAAQLKLDQDNWNRYFSNGSFTDKVGATAKIKVVGVNAAGKDIALPADAQITYESTDPKVVTVDAQGNIKIAGPGQAKINITVVFGHTIKSVTMLVTGQ